MNHFLINEISVRDEREIEKGIFNELMYEFEFKRKGTTGHGLKGIPLSPNLLFLISDEEKVKLERLVEAQK